MKKKSTRIVFIVISFTFFLGSLMLLIGVNSFGVQSKDNTTEVSATIKDIHIINTDEEIYINIISNEYNCIFNVNTIISKSINVDRINDLKIGDTIYFRINDFFLDKLNEKSVINIVALRASFNLFSLSEYNLFIQETFLSVKIALLILVILFGTTGTVLCLQMKNKS